MSDARHRRVPDRWRRCRQVGCFVTAALLLGTAGCKKASVEAPRKPPEELRAVEEMTVAELISAHRRAVGHLRPPGRDSHLDTLSISYLQREEEFVMQRQLLCDASGRARVTYRMRPLVVRSLPEGASYDGRTLWRQSRLGTVRGPLAEHLSADLPAPIAWTVLELGLTPLYCPLADKLGFEVRRDSTPPDEPGAYSLLIGPSDKPYMRVILDRKTHLIRRIERLLDGQVQVTLKLQGYRRSPGIDVFLPEKVLSYTGEATDEPTSTWTLALLQSMRLITQPERVYARGKLPDLETRMQQKSRFVYAANVAVPPNPQSVHTADFDGDGLLDLVVPAERTVAILYHDGRTPFGRWQPLLSTRGLHRCAVPADFDADGRADLLTTVNSALPVAQDLLFLLRNTGNRRFDDPVPLSTPKGPQWLVAGMLDDDALMDFVAVSATESMVVVFPGRMVPVPGGVELRPVSAYEFELGGQGRCLGLGDFNGDYLTDIVATNESRLVVLTRRVGEAGKLDYETTEYETGEMPFAVVVADFDGDGRDDVAVGNGGDANGDAAPEVVVLLADEAGKLVRTTTLVAGAGVAALVAADLDNDGDKDLAAACFEDHSVYTWPNNGDGTFGNPDVLWTDYGPRGLVAGDFNDDGRRDLAVVHQYGNSVAILLNLNPWHEFVEEEADAAATPTTQPVPADNAGSD